MLFKRVVLWVDKEDFPKNLHFVKINLILSIRLNLLVIFAGVLLEQRVKQGWFCQLCFPSRSPSQSLRVVPLRSSATITSNTNRQLS